MAKKAAPIENEADDFVQRLADQVERDYGSGIISDGLTEIAEKRQVIPFSPVLDQLLSGGVQEGSWLGISGSPKLGKTTSALSFAANCQKPEYGSRPIYYFKVEGRLSTVHLKGIKGLSLEKGKFNIVQGRRGRLLTGQDFLNIAANVLRTVPQSVLIFDSISCLMEEKESVDGLGAESRGGGAKIFSQFCRLMNQVIGINKSIFVGVSHLISNTSGYGAHLIEKGARAWDYMRDFSLRIVSAEPWEHDGREIGKKVQWVCKTSALGPPGRKETSFIRYGLGIDRLFELMELGMSAGLVKKAGSWMSFPFLKDAPEVKVQGGEAAYQLLVKNPEWAKALESELSLLSSGQEKAA